MKKHWLFLSLLVLLAAGPFGALPKSREMEELKLVTTLALDGERVTAVTGVRTTEEETAQALTGEGKSLAEACYALRGSSARRVYLGQTEQLLIGEGQDLTAALDFVLRDRELRLDTLLYIVKGEAGAALAASVSRISGETGGQDPRGRTVGELLARLSQGDYTLAPALAPDGEGMLTPAGWAVLGPDGVEGYLEDKAAQGADLLMGLGIGQAAALPGGSVEFTGVRTAARGGALRCCLTARAVEGAPSEEELARWGGERLRAALALGWDCWGLDRELAALEPWRWKTWKNTPVAGLKICVEVTLTGGKGRG